MKTDAALYQIFERRPDWLGDLTRLQLPKFSKASSQAFKKSLQVECDLIFEPESKSDPPHIVELQMYFDHSIFNRTELARNLIWKQRNRKTDCLKVGYRPVEVLAIVIFGDRRCLPEYAPIHPSIRVLFLDELLADLEEHDPESPLVPLLTPLVASNSELEKNGGKYYSTIAEHPALQPDERELLTGIFVHWFTQRFHKLPSTQIDKMLAQLTPLEKTTAGKELIERGIERGAEQERRELIRKIRLRGLSIEEIEEMLGLSREEIEHHLDGD